VRDIASDSGTSVGSVETIIHEHLSFKTVCAWWVLKMLTFDSKAQRVSVFAEHLPRFELEENTFLERPAKRRGCTISLKVEAV
jgi:hypothetical protein